MKKLVWVLGILLSVINVYGQKEYSLGTGHFASGPGSFQMHDPLFSDKTLSGRSQTYQLGLTSITQKKYTEIFFSIARGFTNERNGRESLRNFDLKIREGFALHKDVNRPLMVYAGYGIRTSPSIYDQVSETQKKLGWYTISDFSYYQSFLWRVQKHTVFLDFSLPIIAVVSHPQGVVMQKDASDVSFLISSIYHQSKLTTVPDFFGLDVGARYAFSLNRKFALGVDVDYFFSNNKYGKNIFRQQMSSVKLNLSYQFYKH